MNKDEVIVTLTTFEASVLKLMLENRQWESIAPNDVKESVIKQLTVKQENTTGDNDGKK